MDEREGQGLVEYALLLAGIALLAAVALTYLTRQATGLFGELGSALAGQAPGAHVHEYW